MTSLPSDEAVRARAEQDNLLAPGAELTHDVRRRVIRALLAEQAAPPASAETAPKLLSRSITDAPELGGRLQVDLILIPYTEPRKAP